MKKRQYAEYRQARKEMRDYQTAKYNIDRILNLNTEEQQKEKQKRLTEPLFVEKRVP